MYATAEDVILTPDTSLMGTCDWCDAKSVARVEVWSAGRCLTSDDGACSEHIAQHFGPAVGRMVTDHR